jgi:alpha-L-rhamnosidase
MEPAPMNATWIDLPADAMNVAAGFRLLLDPPAGGATLRLAAADSCRVWIDGRLAAHGPARAAHGFARLEEIPLAASDGNRISIFVEVHSAHVSCFDGVEQDAFFAAEIVGADGRVLAETGDFEAWRDGTLVRRVRRFSFQRGFVESRRVASDPDAFRRGGAAPEGWTRAATVPRALPRLLPRGTSRPALPFLDAGAPVARGAFAVDPAAAAPSPREVEMVGTQGIKGYLRDEWEDDPATEGAQLLSHAEFAESESHAESAEFAESESHAEFAEFRGRARSPSAPNLRTFEPSNLRTFLLYDFGRTITGFFSLRVRAEAPEGATVLLLFDELRAPEGARFPVDPFRNQCANVVKWRLAPGGHDLLSFFPNSARFAAVAIPEGAAEIGRFGVVPYENPDAARAPLPPTGDATLDAIVDAARATFAQNAVDLLTDCPSRERAGWLCDAFFTGRAEALFTGGNAAERAFLENYALAPALPSLPDGMLPMCYPADHPNGAYIPNWTLWWLLELDAYRARTGDEETVAASRPKIGPLLAWFDRHAGPEGLLEDLPGWVFVEWSACNDADHLRGVNFPTNFLWAAALEAAARLLGRPDLAARGAAVRDAAARLAWDGEWFSDNAVRDASGALRRTGLVTETGQYYALYFGAADPATHPALWRRLREEFGPARDPARTWPDIPPSNAIVGAYLRLELLLRDGRAEQCLRECRDFFAPMARLTGTLWENLSPEASLDHGFASSAAWLIHRALAQ